MTPLEKQFADLVSAYPGATKELLPSGAVLIRVPDVKPRQGGWNRDSITVSFLAPAGYPAARPDCFWADADLALAGGQTPSSSNKMPIPEKGGPPLTWFSWHLQSWDPVRDTLLTYVRVIRNRLEPAR